MLPLLAFLAFVLVLPHGLGAAPQVAIADDVHGPLYRRLAAAVVGITCKVKDANPESGQYFGTGVIISTQGLVLTTLTVVPENPGEIKVYLVDGRVLEGRVVRQDKESEGVLLQVQAVGLTAMPLADSTACRLGDPAYSWGNPFHTIMKDGMVSLSAGTISGLYQVSSVDTESRYVGWVLETDAAVNPGSDGGPLTDADGHLLGIQSLAFSRSRWLGTAVPIHRLAEGLPELHTLQRMPRPVFSGARARAWAAELAFPLVLADAAAATVSFRVVREGEKVTLPERRQDEVLTPLAPYPADQRRAARELVRPADAYASGVIISPEGWVLTAAQNLAAASRRAPGIARVAVYLADGRRVSAKILGQDSFYDVALLQLEKTQGQPYPFVALHEGPGPGTGQFIAVLGRSEPPGDLTLNVGLLSATNRFQNTCHQMNVMVNYGNLGGPVVDLEGRLVGLAVRLGPGTPWRQNCGVAFMATAAVLRQIIPELAAGKTLARPARPFLGIEGDVGALDIAGARINRVLPNSAAARAGLQQGDIITEFNGQNIPDWPSLVRSIQAALVGDTVRLKVLRGEQTLDVEVTLGSME
ncbi:MAG: S1C family serine protease [Verrucomicrobiae bacterium]|nr:S1C family serine protease [Verrucomicrobiae bacterium]